VNEHLDRSITTGPPLNMVEYFILIRSKIHILAEVSAFFFR
jgi:hypothetical protein